MHVIAKNSKNTFAFITTRYIEMQFNFIEKQLEVKRGREEDSWERGRGRDRREGGGERGEEWIEDGGGERGGDG